jgi:arylsulfatase A
MNNSMKTLTILLLLSCWMSLEFTLLGDQQPNILLIMADDLGYETITANGSTSYSTPNIDRLAAEGARFEQCFANPICTPSRVKIMTGKYNVRNYTKFRELDRKETTFARLFKKAGYRTVIAGKWQLGRQADSPQHFGFEESCLWQQTKARTRVGTSIDSRYPNPILDINGELKEYQNGEYGPDVCADYISSFIERVAKPQDSQESQPFFAYYPMILTHCPFVSTPKSMDWDHKSLGSQQYKGPGDKALQQQHFSDMLHYADFLVGKIISTLDRLELRENTLIIFTGDNGTDSPIRSIWNGRSVHGGKGSVSDHGTRTPLIANWRGQIAPKVLKDELVDFTDVLPTLCEAANISLSSEDPRDGVSFWPSLNGEPRQAKDYIYMWYEGKTWARTKSLGVIVDPIQGSTSYEKYVDHYKVTRQDLGDYSEDDQATLSFLEEEISRLAKTRPAHLQKKDQIAWKKKRELLFKKQKRKKNKK